MADRGGGIRIYEYVDQDGVTFWSFTRLTSKSVRRLTIMDLRGTHYRRFLVEVIQLVLGLGERPSRVPLPVVEDEIVG